MMIFFRFTCGLAHISFTLLLHLLWIEGGKKRALGYADLAWGWHWESDLSILDKEDSSADGIVVGLFCRKWVWSVVWVNFHWIGQNVICKSPDKLGEVGRDLSGWFSGGHMAGNWWHTQGSGENGKSVSEVGITHWTWDGSVPDERWNSWGIGGKRSANENRASHCLRTRGWGKGKQHPHLGSADLGSAACHLHQHLPIPASAGCQLEPNFCHSGQGQGQEGRQAVGSGWQPGPSCEHS